MAALFPRCTANHFSKLSLEHSTQQILSTRSRRHQELKPLSLRCTKRQSRCQAQKPGQVEAEAAADLENPDAEPADKEEVDLGDGVTGEDVEDDLDDDEEDLEGMEEMGDGEYREAVEEGEAIELDERILDDDDIYPVQATTVYTEEEYAYMCDLPTPSSTVQQTLNRSIILQGLAIHTDMLACVRVMPAFAGEGRYFVLVPPGSIQFEEEPAPKTAEELEAEEAAAAAAAAEKEAKPKKGKAKAKIPWDELSGPQEDAEQKPREPEEIRARRDDEQVVKAVLDNASVFPEDCLFTTLEQSGVKIFSAETLLATLEACGVDNARIEVEARTPGEGPAAVPEELRAGTPDDDEIYSGYKDESMTEMDFQGGQELPFADGSAGYWAQRIKEEGVRVAPAEDGTPSLPKKALVPRKVVSVREGQSFVTLMPCEGQRISVGINYQAIAPVVGAQWASWSPDDADLAHFRWSMAAARPFLPSAEEAFRRRAAGYFKGGLNAGLVATADFGTWIMPEEVRYPDEAVRRRLMEFIADLSLLSQDGKGGIPEGHIVAYQASRDLTLKFMRAVRRLSDEQ